MGWMHDQQRLYRCFQQPWLGGERITELSQICGCFICRWKPSRPRYGSLGNPPLLLQQKPRKSGRVWLLWISKAFSNIYGTFLQNSLTGKTYETTTTADLAPPTPQVLNRCRLLVLFHMHLSKKSSSWDYFLFFWDKGGGLLQVPKQVPVAGYSFSYRFLLHATN